MGDTERLVFSNFQYVFIRCDMSSSTFTSDYCELSHPCKKEVDASYSRTKRAHGNFKMSCQPDRSSAYAEDLRWRMVWQRDGLGYSYARIARNLCVDKSTVWRTVQLFHVTGDVAKKSLSQRSGTQSSD